jgi:hypothetical protein
MPVGKNVQDYALFDKLPPVKTNLHGVTSRVYLPKAAVVKDYTPEDQTTILPSTVSVKTASVKRVAAKSVAAKSVAAKSVAAKSPGTARNTYGATFKPDMSATAKHHTAKGHYGSAAAYHPTTSARVSGTRVEAAPSGPASGPASPHARTGSGARAAKTEQGNGAATPPLPAATEKRIPVFHRSPGRSSKSSQASHSAASPDVDEESSEEEDDEEATPVSPAVKEGKTSLAETAQSPEATGVASAHASPTVASPGGRKSGVGVASRINGAAPASDDAETSQQQSSPAKVSNFGAASPRKSTSVEHDTVMGGVTGSALGVSPRKTASASASPRKTSGVVVSAKKETRPPPNKSSHLAPTPPSTTASPTAPGPDWNTTDLDTLSPVHVERRADANKRASIDRHATADTADPALLKDPNLFKAWQGRVEEVNAQPVAPAASRVRKGMI